MVAGDSRLLLFDFGYGYRTDHKFDCHYKKMPSSGVQKGPQKNRKVPLKNLVRMGGTQKKCHKKR
ncbi:hypothetical protein HanRHA438_Chr10g0456411 [Helianthus annuus]|nr:hypothetical protein HanIR_Chr10g0478811 [Helianthus annuus]KAJ0879861.1 hypothetical protein HanRHA438_Chr10g0456411 [Helianthus annuus]